MVEEKLHNGGGDDDDPRTLLEIAVRDGRVDILRSMLQQLAKGPKFVELIDGQLKDFDGTLLHLAVKLDSVDSVRTLLSSGANPCVQNDDVLDEFVLAVGVNVNSINSPQTQNTGLHYAASFASDKIVKTLCESGETVNARNNQNDTPLHDENQNLLLIFYLAEKRALEFLSLFS
uniref:Uncharacterized protein n=1 Tax=Panagrolaimus davidi TaxID=227884 RepID=A0A914P1K9_9BILA